MTSPVVAPPLVVPTIASGPSARLQLDDPTTLLGIFMAIFAAAAKAVPAIAGVKVEPLYPAAALLAASIVIAVTLYSKHKVQAALVTVAGPALALARQVDPALVTELPPLVQPMVVAWQSGNAVLGNVATTTAVSDPPPADPKPPRAAKTKASDPTVLPPTVEPPLTPPVA